MRRLDVMHMSITVLFCLALPAGQVSGAEAAEPASSPAAAETSPEARAALERTVARYRGLKSYRDHFRCAARLKLKDSEGPEMGYLEGSLVFQAPDRLVSKTEALHAYYDGKLFTRYLPHQRQYATDSSAEATKALAPENWFTMSEDGLAVHPLVALLALRDMPAEKALMISELSGVAPATREGHAGSRLKGRLQITGLPGMPPLDFTAFINEQTQLFEEITVDVSSMLRAFANTEAEGEAEDAETAELLITFQDVVVDADLPDDAFAFDPRGARKVARFGYDAEPLVSPLDLLGQEAPPLSGGTLAGADFDLEAERGRVVVVAFWATCCPQAANLLDELQALIGAHPDEPLTVIGVNRNGAAGEQALRRVLAERRITFAHVLDREGEGATAWHVAALPAVFLIDQRGQVAEACITWDAKSCARQVAALLKSEPLYSPEELRARRAAAGESPGGAIVQVATSQPSGGRLQAGESQSLMASRWNMSEQDVDGDGELELILPGWMGDLSVVKPSTGEVRTVPLRGLARCSIESARVVKIDGETCWLCAAQQGSLMAGGREQRVIVRLYAPGGEALWTFSPDVGEKTNSSATAAAGDLDGDGAVEYAIGLTTYTPVPISENSWSWSDSSSRLLILDSKGRLIEQQELPNQVEWVYIAPSRPGQPAPLLCLSGGELQRFTLAPQPAPQKE
jgi:outer membrane lipoprotein-sorting protein/peroxiredoxin